MKAPVASPHGCLQQLALVHIALNALKFGASQPAQVAGGAHKHLDAMSPRDQLMDQVCTDEPGGARDEAFHTFRPAFGEASCNRAEPRGINRNMQSENYRFLTLREIDFALASSA
jgi:hypothetical protein